MDSKIINRFPIREYLTASGIYAVKDGGYYGMYHSPFREDHDASMKVDYNKNLWIDFGANEGGTLIDLVMRLKRCSTGEAMRLLESHISGTSFSFHGDTSVLTNREPAICVQKEQELANLALIGYLNERKVNIEIARQHCKEIHYLVNGKPYFAIGFHNDAGGYELRNKYFKGCISPKDLTTFDDDKVQCCLFEGFMDMLSYFTLKNKAAIDANVLVLNSVANLSKAMSFLNGQETIHAFLDNDESGQQALKQVQSIGKTVVDQSASYRGFKDLNDYLSSRDLKQTVVRSKGIKR